MKYYTMKSFSTGLNSDEYRNNWEETFSKGSPENESAPQLTECGVNFNDAVDLCIKLFMEYKGYMAWDMSEEVVQKMNALKR